LPNATVWPRDENEAGAEKRLLTGFFSKQTHMILRGTTIHENGFISMSYSPLTSILSPRGEEVNKGSLSPPGRGLG